MLSRSANTLNYPTVASHPTLFIIIPDVPVTPEVNPCKETVDLDEKGLEHVTHINTSYVKLNSILSSG